MNRKNRQLIYLLITFECPLCSAEFKNKVNLKQHLIREHNDIEAESYLNNIVDKLI